MEEPELWTGPPDDPYRYGLWGVIGGGAEGRVYRATRQLVDGHLDVAVKVLASEQFGGVEAVAARWQTQAARLRNINHPGVVGVQEAFLGAPPHARGATMITSGVPHFVMAWVEGQTLAAWCASEPHLEARLRVLENVADALDELHRHEQVHADIKPANLLVTTRQLPTAGTISNGVLVDFGLMRTITGAPPSQLAGTLGYWAPEVLAGYAYTGASDLYALAGVVFFLCTGQDPPFPTGDYVAEIRARMAGAPPGVVDGVAAAMHPDPYSRPAQGCRLWLSALRAGLSSSAAPPTAAAPALFGGAMDPTVPVATVGGGPTLIEAPRRRWPLLVALVALVALAGGVAGVVLTKGSKDRGSNVAAGSTTTLSPTSTTEPGTTTSSSPSTTSSTGPPTTVAPTTAVPTTVVSSALPDRAFLDTFTRVNGDATTGQAKANSVTYLHAITQDAQCQGQRSVEYDLSRAYTLLEGVVALRDDSDSGIAVIYAVYGDEKQLAKGSVALGQTDPIHIDVTGVLRLRLEATTTSTSCRSLQLVWGDLQVTK